MTRKDIKNLAEVCESLKAQCDAQGGAFTAANDFEGFVGRMLWAIHASGNNPQFNEQNFRRMANGENVDIFANE